MLWRIGERDCPPVHICLFVIFFLQHDLGCHIERGAFRPFGVSQHFSWFDDTHAYISYAIEFSVR